VIVGFDSRQSDRYALESRIPLAFGILMIVSLERAQEGKAHDSADWKLTSSLIELGVWIVCALIGFGIALATAAPLGGRTIRPE